MGSVCTEHKPLLQSQSQVLEQERTNCSRPEIQLLSIYLLFFSPIFYFFWKWHQLMRESQASLDTLVDYCTVSAFIFHLSTTGYTLDFDRPAWTAFQKVSSYSTVFPGGLLPGQPACSHTDKPQPAGLLQQDGFAKWIHSCDKQENQCQRARDDICPL